MDGDMHPIARTQGGSLKWWHGWGPILFLPAIVILTVPPVWPRWAFMWTLAFAIYAGCKWLTWRRAAAEEAALWLQCGYLLAWPGMDAHTFFTSAAPVAKPSSREWLFAASKLMLGIGLLFGVTRWVPDQFPYLVGWVGMIGVIMVLHFGAFHLLSCAWRAVGVEARPLMNWPLSSVSITEFWGHRWNTAFRDLTYRFLFRPGIRRLGPRRALLVGFVCSGLIHDAVISLPARGGYGGPTLFFALQAAAVFVERGPVGRSMGLGRGWSGWLFTTSVLLAPVCGLFHPPFVLKIVLPFLRALGAI